MQKTHSNNHSGYLYPLHRWLILAVAAFAITGPGSAEPLSTDPFLDPAIMTIQKLHDEAAFGDSHDTEKLIAALNTALAIQPENHLLHAYMGSALTLKSRDQFPGPSKLRYLKEGLKMMDRAVAKAPADPCVRFVRAVNNYYLPSFVNRRDNAREDFEILLKQISSSQITLNVRTIQAIHYFSGLAFKQTKRPEQARNTWTQGIALAADPGLTQKMIAELDRL